MRINSNIIAALTLFLAPLSSFAAASAQQEGDLSTVLENVSPSIVTVEAVLETKVSMRGQVQNEESRTDLNGVVVDETGLIMISNAAISADRFEEILGGGAMMGQIDIQITPLEFKVIFGNEEKEYPAKLVAKDTKLDLAFLQVEDIEDRSLQPVSFTSSIEPAVGEQIVLVSRLGKGYDYAPYLETGRVAGEVSKPRNAWIVQGALSGYGLPVLRPTGDVAGVLVTLAPVATEEAPARGGFGSMMRMMRGGGLDIGVRTFVLPSEAVHALVKQARQKAEEMRTEEDESTDATDEDIDQEEPDN